ncbi:hypothetical protein ANACOL_02978 [Anaerotruncus colihominis DSM 17241]|uniref:Uncharacterized protein n=1 Tax=Anaerotruncus colihominis DSM 17241 TaxID=445972 RepID=B0PEI7_9FIRM|nr:hypothetical protein ANACOL_02978 [Anaerotruncus colihominis DSM 17241]
MANFTMPLRRHGKICAMRNPLQSSGCRRMAATNGFIVCSAHILP